jgi:meso-butanediol dehydrogenase / (S,S)-butanediol dehydrogenase / diacetyl reductase
MQVAIVTGAAQGIGRAIAERFLKDGISVVAIDRNGEALKSLEGEHLATAVLDVTADDAPARAVALAKERFGRLDVLVNNAGIGNSKPVHLTSDEEIDRFVAVNFRSHFRFTREALGAMKSGAAIVHVASTFGLMGNPNNSMYCSTKAALVGLTRQMAADYGPKGIRVNAVAPGVIQTALVAERLAVPAFRRLMVDTTPFPRLGRPEDVAGAVRFLCSEDAGFVNGHVLVIDGGWSAANYVAS